MRSDICDAITKHLLLDLRYHGYGRTVEPHAYGRDRNGDEVMRCYQIAGGSESGEPAGWKLLKVAEIYSIQVLKQTFTPRLDYRRNDRAMERIYCQI